MVVAWAWVVCVVIHPNHARRRNHLLARRRVHHLASRRGHHLARRRVHHLASRRGHHRASRRVPHLRASPRLLEAKLLTQPQSTTMASQQALLALHADCGVQQTLIVTTVRLLSLRIHRHHVMFTRLGCPRMCECATDDAAAMMKPDWSKDGTAAPATSSPATHAGLGATPTKPKHQRDSSAQAGSTGSPAMPATPSPRLRGVITSPPPMPSLVEGDEDEDEDEGGEDDAPTGAPTRAKVGIARLDVTLDHGSCA